MATNASKRLGDLEAAVKPEGERRVIVVYVRDNDDNTYTNNERTYTRAELDELEQSGTLVIIVKYVTADLPHFG